MSTATELTIVRVLDAPRDRVWASFKDIEALMQWWGLPADAAMSVCTVDFRVGGALLCGSKRPGRPMIWFKCIYQEIVEGELLVMEQHLSDEDGGEHESVDWPASTITLRLKDQGGKTWLTVVHTDVVSPQATVDDYRQGWTESLDRFDAALAQA